MEVGYTGVQDFALAVLLLLISLCSLPTAEHFVVMIAIATGERQRRQNEREQGLV